MADTLVDLELRGGSFGGGHSMWVYPPMSISSNSSSDIPPVSL